MRHRKRDKDVFGLVAPLAGLVVLLTMAVAPARLNFLGALVAVALIIGVLVLAVVVWAVFRRLTQRSKTQLSTLDCDVSRPRPPTPLFIAPSPSPSDRDHQTHALLPSAAPTPPTLQELLTRIRAIDWYQFEKLVELTYRKSGFTVTRRGGANPDGGIDLILRKDGEQTAVQCKHWKTRNVGVKAMREFLGALTDARISKGIFITLSGYSGDAKSFAEKHRIEILNETALARLLETTGVGKDPETTRLLTDPRKFCPKCENEMVMRVAQKGPNPGQQFWGCSRYPRCHYTLEFTPHSSASLAIPLR